MSLINRIGESAAVAVRCNGRHQAGETECRKGWEPALFPKASRQELRSIWGRHHGPRMPLMTTLEPIAVNSALLPQKLCLRFRSPMEAGAFPRQPLRNAGCHAETCGGDGCVWASRFFAM